LLASVDAPASHEMRDSVVIGGLPEAEIALAKQSAISDEDNQQTR
jgi:hypothetical protein